MNKCSVLPYEGEQKYIYVAHSLKDNRYVYPIIEQLVKDGYRVWYDDGLINDSDAAEGIASKITGCDVMIACFSAAALDSYQFKSEINFAITKKKEIIAVLLEENKFSLAMELQMSAFPAVFKYKLDTDVFFERLYSFDILHSCLGEPNASVMVSGEKEYGDFLFDLYGEKELRGSAFNDALSVRLKSKDESEKMHSAVLVRFTTDEEIEIVTPKMVIGRARSDQTKPVVDYSIDTNSMVSRIHAVIIYRNGGYYLVDCGAVNKTYLNSEELSINKEYLLHDGDVIKLANEKFRFRRHEV